MNVVLVKFHFLLIHAAVDYCAEDYACPTQKLACVLNDETALGFSCTCNAGYQFNENTGFCEGIYIILVNHF